MLIPGWMFDGWDDEPEDKNETYELKYYTYGFECPDINKINAEQKEEVYNKILKQFEQQLKEWLIE